MPRLISLVDQASRLILLFWGAVLVVAGVAQADASGLAFVTLGVYVLTLAAVLPRLERVRLFGPYGLDARMGVLDPGREGACAELSSCVSRRGEAHATADPDK